MTDEEAQILRQEALIAKQRAEIVGLRKQRDDLRRMHEADHRHIEKLRKQLQAKPGKLADWIFGDEGE